STAPGPGKDRTDDLQRATTGPVKGYKALWTYLAGPSACFRTSFNIGVLLPAGLTRQARWWFNLEGTSLP
ncbi:MAG: hypothetical protein ABSE77_23180, partial [Acidimicrobiales bacterium]